MDEAIRYGVIIFLTYLTNIVLVIATFGDCKPEDVNVTIGTVVPNYEVYILDAFMNPVPIGAIGELCIGGIGYKQFYVYFGFILKILSLTIYLF